MMKNIMKYMDLSLKAVKGGKGDDSKITPEMINKFMEKSILSEVKKMKFVLPD